MNNVMRISVCFPLLFFCLTGTSQSPRLYPHAPFPQDLALTTRGNDPLLANDSTYDVQFYHIGVEIAIDYPYLTGSVRYILRSQVDGLTSLRLDLDSAFTVDAVSAPASDFVFENKVLTVHFPNAYDTGDLIEFSVFYHGAPVLAGGYKGLRYEKHDGSEPVIASLSTPYLAHTWWPCKDGMGDKADSAYIDITIKDTLVSALPLIAVSNGRLEGVETAGGKKTFKWRHRYPVVPYYLMVAISNYRHFQQTITGQGYDFPIDYYVFDSHLAAAQSGMAPMPEVMGLFTSLFGPYPFLSEKYGMTQLGYYGAIENQTNTIINNMSPGWLYVSVHELAHQWFADMITCETWHHGWLNEGFASYAEALWAEHVGGTGAYRAYMASMEFYQGGTLYLYDVSNPFSVFQTIIYDKGAYTLHMLRGILGDQAFFDAVYAYAANPAFQYGHAATEDFQSVCESESGLDLDYFFEEWIYDERYPKYSYNYSFHPETGNLDLALAQTQSNEGWRPVFSMPVQIGVAFGDGTDTIVSVFNNSQIQYFSFSFGKEPDSIAIDPHKWILREVVFDPSLEVGTEEAWASGVEVYPNPNTGSFLVKIPSGISGSDIELGIFDIHGKEHFFRAPAPGEAGAYEVEINGLDNGVYFLHLTTGNRHYGRKVIVVK